MPAPASPLHSPLGFDPSWCCYDPAPHPSPRPPSRLDPGPQMLIQRVIYLVILVLALWTLGEVDAGDKDIRDQVAAGV